jgi:hypothetical protein
MRVEESPTVAIVGAGMAGLATAHYLAINHIDFVIYEALGRPGGRVASSHVDGLTLDRGFQIILEDYPELRRLVAVQELPLHRLYPGVYIPQPGEPLLLSDPRRVPGTYRAMAQTITSLVGMPGLRALGRYLGASEPTIADLVALLPKHLGASVVAPLLRGITLDPSLGNPSDFARFIMGRFFNGYASLPTEGMGQLPAILASELNGHIEYHHRVTSVATGTLSFEDQVSAHPDWIVLAVDPPELEPLVGLTLPPMHRVGFIHVLSDTRLFGVPAVLLPPPESPIFTAAPMSDIAPSYVNYDAQRHLITASFDPKASPAQVHQALADTLGCQAESLEIVELGIIEHALPRPARCVSEVGHHVLLAGDYLESPSMNGAIASGRKAAERIIRSTATTPKEP